MSTFVKEFLNVGVSKFSYSPPSCPVFIPVHPVFPHQWQILSSYVKDPPFVDVTFRVEKYAKFYILNV